MRFDHEREMNDPDWEQQAESQRHRELDLKEALDECKAKGVSKDALQTLVFETGARWTTEERK